MTRIRYIKNEDGTMVSKIYQTIDDQVFINIKLDNSFIIYNLKGQVVTNSEGAVKTLPEAKKLVKKALAALGVTFKDEVRPRVKNAAEALQEKLEGDDINESELVQCEKERFGDK